MRVDGRRIRKEKGPDSLAEIVVVHAVHVRFNL